MQGSMVVQKLATQSEVWDSQVTGEHTQIWETVSYQSIPFLAKLELVQEKVWHCFEAENFECCVLGRSLPFSLV